MPFSYETETILVATNQVVIPFDYISKDHVKFKVNAVLQSPSSYTWVDDHTVQFGSTLAVNTVVQKFRETPANDPAVTFTSGSLDHKDLNLGLLQLLFICQEAFDQALLAGTTSAAILDYLAQITTMYNEIVIAYNAIQDLQANYDMIISCPFEPVPGEYSGSWSLPYAASFSGSVTGWKLFTNAAPNTTCTFQLMLRSGAPLVDGQVLATGTINSGQTVGSWVASGLVFPYAIPSGAVLAIKCTAANDTLRDFSSTVTLQRA